MLRRPRRNRKSPVIRELVQENFLSLSDLIYPMFVMEGQGVRSEIASMPGVARFSLDLLLEEMQECVDLGLRTFALFPNLPESKKDKYATESHNPEGLYLQAVKAIKTRFPDIALMTDVAMDPYSSDGHDGIVEEKAGGFEVVNDESLVVLGKMALAQARAGADIIGPSDMMDGRIGYIRELLDSEGFTNVSIMAYFYGPFRDALDSAPRFGDKKTYQMNPANSREALIEAELDYAEGADFLMVKPAMVYLDIIKLLSDNFDLPIAAYNVSGEYAMVKAAAANGWIDHDRAMLEILTAMKRAGAKIILTYFAKEVALLRKS
jgi:porphobilinogen synthase